MVVAYQVLFVQPVASEPGVHPLAPEAALRVKVESPVLFVAVAVYTSEAPHVPEVPEEEIVYESIVGLL